MTPAEERRAAALQREIDAIWAERTLAWNSTGQQLFPIGGPEADPEQVARLEADDAAARARIAELDAELQRLTN